MRQLKIFRWAAALTLAIAVAPSTASAQEADTLTISSTFYMDWLYGTVGPDLAEVYANGHEHTWTLTLYGTTKSHSTFSFIAVNYATEIHATSFDLEFFGPDAATLNGIVSEHIAGGDVSIYLRNAYSLGFGNDFAIMYVWPSGPDMWFFAGHDTFGSNTLFPTDADGYPVVGPEPFSIWTDYSELRDNRPGNDGYIASDSSLVTFEWSVGPLPGDFDLDNDVDGIDFLKWQRGESPDPLSSDDLADWETNYGTDPSPLAAATSTVPEPAAIVLVGICALGFVVLRRRPHSSES
jgi:hypothetical protein